MGLSSASLTVNHSSPELLLTSRGQVTVDESKRRAVEHEGHAHCTLVSYKTEIAVNSRVGSVNANYGTLKKNCTLTQGVGDPRLHAVGEDVGDPVLVLRLSQDHDPYVPQSVDRHLVVRR